MPGLLIEDRPAQAHARLKARAALRRRSMSREALVILEQALGDEAGPPTLEEIDAMRVRGSRPSTRELLGEARESGRP